MDFRIEGASTTTEIIKVNNKYFLSLRKPTLPFDELSCSYRLNRTTNYIDLILAKILYALVLCLPVIKLG